MREVLVDEEVEEFGEPEVVLDQHQEGHFCIDELPGDCVEVDFDGGEVVRVADFFSLGEEFVTL
jgi:hypothetical protein